MTALREYTDKDFGDAVNAAFADDPYEAAVNAAFAQPAAPAVNPLAAGPAQKPVATGPATQDATRPAPTPDVLPVNGQRVVQQGPMVRPDANLSPATIRANKSDTSLSADINGTYEPPPNEIFVPEYVKAKQDKKYISSRARLEDLVARGSKTAKAKLDSLDEDQQQKTDELFEGYQEEVSTRWRRNQPARNPEEAAYYTKRNAFVDSNQPIGTKFNTPVERSRAAQLWSSGKILAETMNPVGEARFGGQSNLDAMAADKGIPVVEWKQGDKWYVGAERTLSEEGRKVGALWQSMSDDEKRRFISAVDTYDPKWGIGYHEDGAEDGPKTRHLKLWAGWDDYSGATKIGAAIKLWGELLAAEGAGRTGTPDKIATGERFAKEGEMIIPGAETIKKDLVDGSVREVKALGAQLSLLKNIDTMSQMEIDGLRWSTGWKPEFIERLRKMSPEEREKQRWTLTEQKAYHQSRLDQYIIDLDEAATRGKTWGSDAWFIAAEAAVYMLEIYATGGLALKAGAPVKHAIRSLVRSIGKKLPANATRKLVRASAKILGNIGGVLAGEAVRTAVLPHRISDKIAELSMPGVKWTDGKPTVTITPKSGEMVGRAIAESYIELVAERSGGMLSKITGVAAVKRTLGDMLAKSGPKGVAKKLIGALLKKTGRHMTRAQYQGLFGEFAEERLTTLLQNLSGYGPGMDAAQINSEIGAFSRALKGVFPDGDQMLAELIGLGVIGGAGAAVGYIAGEAKTASEKKARRKAIALQELLYPGSTMPQIVQSPGVDMPVPGIDVVPFFGTAREGEGAIPETPVVGAEIPVPTPVEATESAPEAPEAQQAPDTLPSRRSAKERVAEKKAEGKSVDEAADEVKVENEELADDIASSTQDGDIYRAESGQLYRRNGDVWTPISEDGRPTLGAKHSHLNMAGAEKASITPPEAQQAPVTPPVAAEAATPPVEAPEAAVSPPVEEAPKPAPVETPADTSIPTPGTKGTYTTMGKTYNVTIDSQETTTARRRGKSVEVPVAKAYIDMGQGADSGRAILINDPSQFTPDVPVEEAPVVEKPLAKTGDTGYNAGKGDRNADKGRVAATRQVVQGTSADTGATDNARVGDTGRVREAGQAPVEAGAEPDISFAYEAQYRPAGRFTLGEVYDSVTGIEPGGKNDFGTVITNRRLSSAEESHFGLQFVGQRGSIPKRSSAEIQQAARDAYARKQEAIEKAAEEQKQGFAAREGRVRALPVFRRVNGWEIVKDESDASPYVVRDPNTGEEVYRNAKYGRAASVARESSISQTGDTTGEAAPAVEEQAPAAKPKLSWGKSLKTDRGRVVDARAEVSVGDPVIGSWYDTERGVGVYEAGFAVKVLKQAIDIKTPDGRVVRVNDKLSKLTPEDADILNEATKTPAPAAKPKAKKATKDGAVEFDYDSPSGDRRAVRIWSTKYADAPAEAKVLVDQQHKAALEFREFAESQKWFDIQQGKTGLTVIESRIGEQAPTYNINTASVKTELRGWMTRDLYDAKFNAFGEKLRGGLESASKAADAEEAIAASQEREKSAKEAIASQAFRLALDAQSKKTKWARTQAKTQDGYGNDIEVTGVASNGLLVYNNKSTYGRKFQVLHLKSGQKVGRHETQQAAKVSAMRLAMSGMHADMTTEQLKARQGSDEYKEWNRIAQDAYSTSQAAPPVSEPAPVKGKRIISDEAVAAADKVIESYAKGERLITGLPTDLLRAYATKGLRFVEEGIRKFADWSAKMVAELGPDVEPHLKAVWRKIAKQKQAIVRIQRNAASRTDAIVNDKSDAEVEAAKSEYRRKIMILANEMGLPQTEQRAIFKKHGDVGHLTSKRMTEAGLAAILDAVKKARPHTVNRETVVTRKTERQIGQLKDALMDRGELTDADFADMLKSLEHSRAQRGKHRKVKTAGYASAADFITQSEAAELQQMMNDKAPVIGRRVRMSEALGNQPEVAMTRDRILRDQEAKEGNRTPRFNEFIDSRYAFMGLEARTGHPFYEAWEGMNDAHLLVRRKVNDFVERVQSKSPKFKKIANSSEAQDRIATYIESKLDGEQVVPDGMTADEIAVANELESVMTEVQDAVRVARFMDWHRHGTPIPNATDAAMNEARDIYLTQGDAALRAHLRNQSWGVIKKGYLPQQVIRPNVGFTGRSRPIFGKGHTKTRVAKQESDVDLFNRVESYLYQILNLSELEPHARALQQVFRDAVAAGAFGEGTKARKRAQRAGEQLDRTIMAAKGQHEGSNALVRILRKGWSQAATAIFLDPTKWVRNKFQNLAFGTHRRAYARALFTKMSAEDAAYFDMNVSQMHGVLKDLMMSRPAESIPILGPLNRAAHAVNLYALTDETNRAEAFKAALLTAREALDAHGGDIEALLAKSRATELEPLQQARALEIFASEGGDAFARYVAKEYTNNVHFLYDRAQRPAAEMGEAGQVLGNLLTFPRSWVQRAALAMKRVIRGRTHAERWRGAQTVIQLTVLSALAGMLYQMLTGKERNPYAFWRVWEWEFGGLATGAAQQAKDVVDASVSVASGEPGAAAALGKTIDRSAKMFIPFAKTTIDTIEGATGTKHVVKTSVQQMLESKYTSPKEQQQVERTIVGMIQKMAFGGTAEENRKSKSSEVISRFNSAKRIVDYHANERTAAPPEARNEYNRLKDVRDRLLSLKAKIRGYKKYNYSDAERKRKIAAAELEMENIAAKAMVGNE